VWGGAVDNCVDLPLDDKNSDDIAIADFEATLSTRRCVEDALAELSADMRDELTAWLAGGPDHVSSDSPNSTWTSFCVEPGTAMCPRKWISDLTDFWTSKIDMWIYQATNSDRSWRSRGR
jgi:hypothetical protein